jgi:uncharacterized protein YcfJ
MDYTSLRQTAAAAILPTVLLAACAGASYRPIVDMRGHTDVAYAHDLSECQQLAQGARDNANTAKDLGLGALGGAAIGAVGGAIGGNVGRGAGIGALAGAVGGGVLGEATNENREERVVKNCMQARGYNVLG